MQPVDYTVVDMPCHLDFEFCCHLIEFLNFLNNKDDTTGPSPLRNVLELFKISKHLLLLWKLRLKGCFRMDFIIHLLYLDGVTVVQHQITSLCRFRELIWLFHLVWLRLGNWFLVKKYIYWSEQVPPRVKVPECLIKVYFLIQILMSCYSCNKNNYLTTNYLSRDLLQ